MSPDDAPLAEMNAIAGQEFHIVLKPLSHPELGDIRIDENLFAIGRTEAPFVSYASDIVHDLSRRHARIFSEHGAVFIADLDSKNGTSVNGINIRQKTCRLHHDDEIRFGGTLSYRVQLDAHADMPGAPERAAKLASLTLTPERDDLGLQPIVLTQFPFLISKADTTFSRYQIEYPHQVNYISRRHAHIFLKRGVPFVEDLGSTNGTFVAGKRLDEHAVPLRDGDLLAFGGHHFVYKVSLQMEECPSDTTMTRLSPVVARSTTQDSGETDKTTFVAAADSFLDIFCVDHAAPQDEVLDNEELKQPDTIGKGLEKRKARSRLVIFLSELSEAFAGGERKSKRRVFGWGASLAAVLAMIAFALHLAGSPEGELKELLASGDYARAATAASQYLEHDPDNAELKALGTEAILKANLPKWLTFLNAREFDRASTVLAGMQEPARHNPDLQSLLSELEWIGNLEKFVIGRGGVEAPIRIYADEDKIRNLLKRWDEDTQGHQRAFDTIASHVPEFKDRYAEALSHLRKLQSDASVYLTAIDRLKSVVGTELNRDRPEALDAVLKDYAEKYPRLGGLDNVRQDLRTYTEIENQMHERRLGPLIALLAKARFVSPPFQARVGALTNSGRLPSSEVAQQYQAVSKPWHEGDTRQTFTALQKMAAGPWADVASKELAHKQAVMQQFAALQKAHGTKGDKDYDERLLSFYGSLDPEEDTYFIQATEANLGLNKDKALRRAQENLSRAEAQWRQYRENGAIEGGQRLEAAISNQFRTRARLLSNAREDAQQGMRIYTQLKVDQPIQWRKVQDEINAEAAQQRRALLELRNVLEPGLLEAKLALLGGHNDDERQSPETAH